MKRNNLTFISLIVAIALLVYLILYLSQATNSDQDDWKKRTTPLPKETRDLLCNNFELPPEHSLCSGDKDVYALDFVRILKDTFKPYEEYGIKSSEAATYDEVDGKIGIFEYECEPVVYQADGLTYFYCSYDLRGDRKFVMTIMYTYPEKAVMRVMSTSRFEDY